MPIPFNKYVRITSGIGGGDKVNRRDLIGRILTDNEFIGPNEVIEVTNSSDVRLNIFDSNSYEMRLVNDYFGYVSPTQGSAKKLSFGSYYINSMGPGSVIKAVQAPVVTEVVALKETTLNFMYNNEYLSSLSVSFTGAEDMAKIVAVITAALANKEKLDPKLIGATVNLDRRNRLRIQLGDTFFGKFSIVSDRASQALKLDYSSGAIEMSGPFPENIDTPLVAFKRTVFINPNFGSFGFLVSTRNIDLEIEDEVELASYNQTLDSAYMACFNTGIAFEKDATALKDYLGVSLTYNRGLEFLFPMIIMGATEYDRPNCVQNYMYRQHSSYDASVDDGSLSDKLDSLRVNYYGSTSSAGQTLSFYQRGLLMGDISDMNVFANEMWLKNYASSQIMSLLMGTSQISANSAGRAQITNILQQVVVDALDNGVITVDKELTAIQKNYIAQQTNDPLAWLSIQKNGYILKVTIKSEKGEYFADYMLLYSKGDAVRKVIGTHSLI